MGTCSTLAWCFPGRASHLLQAKHIFGGKQAQSPAPAVQAPQGGGGAPAVTRQLHPVESPGGAGQARPEREPRLEANPPREEEGRRHLVCGKTPDFRVAAARALLAVRSFCRLGGGNVYFALGIVGGLPRRPASVRPSPPPGPSPLSRALRQGALLGGRRHGSRHDGRGSVPPPPPGPGQASCRWLLASDGRRATRAGVFPTLLRVQSGRRAARFSFLPIRRGAARLRACVVCPVRLRRKRGAAVAALEGAAGGGVTGPAAGDVAGGVTPRSPPPGARSQPRESPGVTCPGVSQTKNIGCSPPLPIPPPPSAGQGCGAGICGQVRGGGGSWSRRSLGVSRAAGSKTFAGGAGGGFAPCKDGRLLLLLLLLGPDPGGARRPAQAQLCLLVGGGEGGGGGGRLCHPGERLPWTELRLAAGHGRPPLCPERGAAEAPPCLDVRAMPLG